MGIENDGVNANVQAALARARAASAAKNDAYACAHGSEARAGSMSYGAVASSGSSAVHARAAGGCASGGYAGAAGASGAAADVGAAAGVGALSVSAALALAKGALEGITVRIVGEVSEFSNKPGYKAVYFTVKDKSAALPCMMWNNRYAASGVELAQGALVELTGRFTLYAAKGRMNFDVFSISLSGEGNLRLQVANLAKKLESEGLMAAAKKRRLPRFPQTIGLVTSPRGAAVHDVLRTLRRRYPVAKVLVAGVPVEGTTAALGIARGISEVARAGAEVVLVVRGGGSFEDLMPFNDEGLARAIAACPVPVVTGIGHEPDTTIADMVADVRASTPTAAAETASPSRENLEAYFAARAQSLFASESLRIERERARIDRAAASGIFRDSSRLFAEDAQTLDFCADRLSRALPARLDRDAARLRDVARRFARSMPGALSEKRARVDMLRNRTRRAGASLMQPFAADVALAASRMHDLSPLAVLARGYAVARTPDGHVVKSVRQTRVGDVVDVEVADGRLACRVESVFASPHANTKEEG